MRKLVFLILLLPVLLGAYLSERNSFYEQYMYRKIQTGQTDVYYNFMPCLRSQWLNMPEGKYEQFLFNGLIMEKQDLTEGRLFGRTSITEEYGDSLFTRYTITAGAEFDMTERIHAGITAYVENGTDNKRAFHADVQEFSDNDLMKVIGVFERGYISYETPDFFAVIGRTDYSDMINPSGSLLYSYNAPPVDGIWLGGRIKNFEYSFRFSYLGYQRADSTYRFYYIVEERDVIDRFIAYHSFSYEPVSNLKLTLGESSIFGRSDLTGIMEYAFPFYFYYAEQNNVGINDNILWHAGIDVKISNIMLNYSFLVDDYQYGYEGTKDLEPPMIGHLFSADAAIPNGRIRLESHWINAWVYNQILPWNRYEINGNNIGYALAPDMRDIIIYADYALSGNLLCKIKGGYYLKGDNYTDTDWAFPVDSLYYYETHYGIEPVEEYFDGELTLNFLWRMLSFEATGGYKYSNIQANSGIRANFGLKLYI